MSTAQNIVIHIALAFFMWSLSRKFCICDYVQQTGTEAQEWENKEDILELSQTSHPVSAPPKYEFDKKGYIIFCLCMGRIGNQMEHFLGGLAFAKSLDRTLILPPFRTYRNVPFREWFDVDAVAEYHRVITAEAFMQHLAPTYWPPGERKGFCWTHPQKPSHECKMKEGNPFGPFWDGLGVDFDSYELHSFSYGEWSIRQWKERYQPDRYPVIALKGAPAPYPMNPQHRPLQRYLKFAETISSEGQNYIDSNFPQEKFVGIHLRNGMDWENACKHAEGMSKYMASPQCQDSSSIPAVTSDMCLPSQTEILRLVRKIIETTGAKVLFIATDKNPMLKELKAHLEDLKVTVYHFDPQLPMVDQYILTKADHFIGNCVSSFTSFVTRDRAVHDKPTSFFGVN